MFQWRQKATNAILLDDNTGGKGRYFKARILQPGLVKYSFGVCLLEKEAIDKFIFEFVGCPVIIGHNDVTTQNADELSCGNICHVWYDNYDGWYWVDGIIDNQDALNKIESGFNVSCQYEITEYANNKEGKLHNGNPYDKVILNGKPEHLAIVETPRYESAMIAVNAIEVASNKGDDEKGRWITLKGTHLFIRDDQTLTEAMKEHGMAVDRKYDRDDANFDEEQLKKDIQEAHEQGLKTIEDVADYLGLEYEEVSETIDLEELKELQGSDGEAKKDNRSFEKYANNILKRARIFDMQDVQMKNDGYTLRFTVPTESFQEQRKKLEKIVAKDKLASKCDSFGSQNGRTTVEIEFQKPIGKNAVRQAINEIKDTDMFKTLFKKKEQEMDEKTLKKLFTECLQEVLIAKNEEDEKDEAMEDDEEKEAKNKCKNEDVDKRKLIDEVAGIMKSAGCDDELIRTAIGKMEKLGYDKSEAGTADNGKKGKNEDEDEEEKKEEAKNKAKNSIDSFKGLLTSAGVEKAAPKYITQSDAIELGNKMFG